MINTLNMLKAPGPATGSDHDRLVKQTEVWVSQTFFGTLLKQMRESPFRNEMFDGGRGGQAFGAMFDQHLAENMSRGAGRKLVNAIVRRIEAKAAYAKSQNVATAEAVGTENSTNGGFTENPDARSQAGSK